MQCLIQFSLVSSVHGVSMPLVVLCVSTLGMEYCLHATALCVCVLCIEYTKYSIHKGVSMPLAVLCGCSVSQCLVCVSSCIKCIMYKYSGHSFHSVFCVYVSICLECLSHV